MRLRIQCLLIVLLFAAVGALCRQQRVDAPTYQISAQLSQPIDTHAENALRDFAHSMLASEMVTSTSPENSTKASVRGFDLPDRGSCPKPEARIVRSFCSADLHPDPTAYYVYWLENIRI